jgi:hypothetical protein
MPTYEEWKRENWDRAHQENDISALTGTGLDAHLNTLGAAHLATYDISLLCIGVGTGGWVAEAADRYASVHCLDVSTHAARKIPAGVGFTLSPDMLPRNHFDLALSLWVAPHMNDADLQEQLHGVIASLKPEGVFALHYKSPIDPGVVIDNRAGADDEWQTARSAAMLRRPEHVEDMARRAGGRFVQVVQENISFFYGVNEISVHISRGK